MLIQRANNCVEAKSVGITIPDPSIPDIPDKTKQDLNLITVQAEKFLRLYPILVVLRIYSGERDPTL